LKQGFGGKPVFSTDPAWTPPCEACGRPEAQCICRKEPRPAAGGQTVRLRIERAGRGGKTVTLVEGLRGSPDWLRDLARDLKGACGAGGSVKQGAIELQGDQRDRAAKALEKRGFQVKRGN